MTQQQLPGLSIIVVVHAMPRQAMNTLYSLCSDYQRDICEDSYEVVVVENSSDQMLDPGAVAQMGNNFRYIARDDAGVSPAPAINHALERCRGTYVGLLIDGARMLTPRVLSYSLQLLEGESSVVVTPAYYLTSQGKVETGQTAAESDSILHHEADLLQRNGWKEDGYQLFNEACFSNGNRRGFLNPIMECTALFCARSQLVKIGGADECFDLPGGGALNLHMYRTIATAPDNKLYVLPGEGNFHQYHAGASTTAGPERDALVQRFKAQLDAHWPGGFKSVSREPILHGAVTRQALPFLQQSSDSGRQRLERFASRGMPPWPDDMEQKSSL